MTRNRRTSTLCCLRMVSLTRMASSFWGVLATFAYVCSTSKPFSAAQRSTEVDLPTPLGPITARHALPPSCCRRSLNQWFIFAVAISFPCMWHDFSGLHNSDQSCDRASVLAVEFSSKTTERRQSTRITAGNLTKLMPMDVNGAQLQARPYLFKIVSSVYRGGSTYDYII